MQRDIDDRMDGDFLRVSIPWEVRVRYAGMVEARCLDEDAGFSIIHAVAVGNEAISDRSRRRWAEGLEFGSIGVPPLDFMAIFDDEESLFGKDGSTTWDVHWGFLPYASIGQSEATEDFRVAVDWRDL